jgi:CheY-like chemotaxis protein
VNDFFSQPNVLVLEDDPGDALLIRRAFQKAGCDPFICRNTSEATAYLLGSGMYSDRRLYPLPDILITDLRLGQDSGIKLLSWLRSTHLKDLPVVVLSGAATPGDILAVQRLKAERVLIKPSNPDDLFAMLQETCEHICCHLKDREPAELEAVA